MLLEQIPLEQSPFEMHAEPMGQVTPMPRHKLPPQSIAVSALSCNQLEHASDAVSTRHSEVEASHLLVAQSES
jgi:hypothetical protein